MQDYESRNHHTTYLTLATHQFSEQAGGTNGSRKRNRAGSSGNPPTNFVNTELIVSISNWHFNRDAQNNPDEVICRLSDVTISIKFACNLWAKANAKPTDYPFDREGISIPYSTFLSLLSDRGFVNGFIPTIKEKYESHEKIKLPSIPKPKPTPRPATPMPTEDDNEYEGTQQYEIVEEEEDVIDLRPNESDVEANVDVDIGVESEGRSNNDDDDDDDEALLPTKTNRRAKFTGTVVGKRVKK